MRFWRGKARERKGGKRKTEVNEHDEDESCRSHDPGHISHIVDDIVSRSDQVTCREKESSRGGQ